MCWLEMRTCGETWHLISGDRTGRFKSRSDRLFARQLTSSLSGCCFVTERVAVDVLARVADLWRDMESVVR